MASRRSIHYELRLLRDQRELKRLNSDDGKDEEDD